MTFLKFSRWLIAVLALAVALAACGGSDDTTAAETTDSETEAEEAESSVEPAQLDSSTTTVDDRTDRERAIDQLDLMLLQLGVGDLVATADCVVDRLDEEGIEIVGQGAPELAAALACDRGVADQLFSAASFDLPPADGQCVVDGLIDAIIDIPLAESEAFFGASMPPAEVLEMIATECGVAVEQLNQGFG